MKTRHTLSMALLAIGSLLGFSGRREELHNEASTAGTHANGVIPLVAEVTMASRYLLVQKGAADNGFIVNVATTRPWGVCLDEPVFDASKVTKAAVALLGCAEGTLKGRVNGATLAGAKLWTAAGGKLTSTYAAGAFYCGRGVNATSGDGDIVELAHNSPLLDASGTTL